MESTFFVETYGCTSNKFDSEKMIGFLQKRGYKLVEDEENADYILVNSCAVKSTTEDKIISRLKELTGRKKSIVVAGCLTKVNPARIREAVPGVALLDPRGIHHVGDVFERVEQGEKDIEAFSPMPVEKPALPGFSFSPVIGIVKMSEGCLSNCTFCATKLARGDLYSYRPDIIRDAFIEGVKEGFKEFHLTSEDASAYGRDLRVHLSDLLASLVKIQGDFKIRVGMMNPLHFLRKEDALEKLIEIFKDPKIFKFLHLCVQSGSNKVLNEMRRGYTVEDFKKIASAFRKEIPEITIWTDFIVGFPGETEEDFRGSLRLFQELDLDFANISGYAVRRSTWAAKMKQISSEVKKKRGKVISEMMNNKALEKNKKWVGWRGRALIDEYKKEKGNFVGRNDSYKPIVLKNSELKLGMEVEVEIVDAKATHLVGRMLS